MRIIALFTTVTGSVLALGGCATLPANGPTRAQISHDARRVNEIGFHIVDLSPTVIDALEAVTIHQTPLASLAAVGQVDTIGTGDVLDISIYEVGVALFGASSAGGQGTPGNFDPTARATTLQNITVNARGELTIPYVGQYLVAGKTSAQVERTIEQGMRGLSQRPQVVVTIKQNLFNTFYISGDIRQPGRLGLTLPRERLLDAIARAGGTTTLPNDVIVRLTRGGRSAEVRLSEIESAGAQNVELLPGDRIELFNRPRTFQVFGSTDKVSQVAFGQSQLSLAEALARIGGPSERTADPAAVYIFRYEPSPVGTRPNDRVPVVYRANLIRAQTYFLSQRFEMQDRDVIYIASAAANAPSKLAQIFGTLFSPVAAAAYLVK